MSGSDILINVLGGVALLLWGARMIRTGMMRAFGASLRAAIGSWTSNRVKAALIGALAAATVQSSTATALMVCSFVAHGALLTVPALAVMLGADLGAAIGAQIFTSGVSGFWPILAFVGYLMHTLFDGANARLRHLGRVTVGLAILLLALRMIGNAAGELGGSEVLSDVLQAIADEPLLAILIGALLTWLAYSSLALILVVASLAAGGLLPAPALFPIVLGINLGAALPAITATMGEPVEARRIPVGNLVFRLLGVLIALPFLDLATAHLQAFDADPMRLIVNFHLLFNLALCIGLIAFISPIGQLVESMMPAPIETAGADEGPRHLDESLLDTPSVAIAMAARETMRIGDTVEQMLDNSLLVLEHNDDGLRREVEAADDVIDELHEAVKLYLTRLSRGELDDEDSRRAVDIIAFTTNLEHVGDIIDKNLMELAAKKIRQQLQFSNEGLQDLKKMHARLMETVRLSLTVFINQELETATQLLARKEQFRTMELRHTERHLARLRSGQAASIETSALHLDIIRDFKRINSHLTSVAYPILDRAGALRTTRLRSAPEGSAPRLSEGQIAKCAPARP
ncbi:MAG: Na/Pi cotransporter family protein [Alphaproteobacteria bacterium]|nr:Na/Pi cotransporter family protein [Alphaproteobacteria bacterium]